MDQRKSGEKDTTQSTLSQVADIAMDPLRYRFYPQSIPSTNDIVVVRVKNVTSLGVYVELIEYACAEGMIVISELSKRRIRSVHQLVKEGQVLCCLVIRVNKEKGYIDLSKRRVTPEDVKEHMARYSRAKAVHSIIIRSAHLLGYSSVTQVSDFYSRTAWHVNGSSYSGNSRAKAYRVFWKVLENPAVLHDFQVVDDAKVVLESTIRNHFKYQTVLIKACIALTCLGPDGVDAVKESLKEGLKLATDDMPLKIRYLNSPSYVVSVETESRNVKNALDLVTAAIAAVESRIQLFRGGRFSLLEKPTVSSDIRGGNENGDEKTDDDNLSDTDYSSCSQSDEEDVEDSDDKDDSKKSSVATKGEYCAITYPGEDSGIGNEDPDRQ